jgi:hypothetical protein
MSEKWTKPDLAEVRVAVEETLSDLESIRREVLSVSKESTPGARLVRYEYWGTLSATRKRLAEVEFLAGRGEWRSTLRDALADLWEGLNTGAKSDHWVLGQYVVLRAVLGESPEQGQDWWSEKAWQAAQLTLDNVDPQERMWAHSSIADLLMVAQADGLPKIAGEAPRDVVTELKKMVDVGGGPAQCPAVWPTFRQFWRWRYWWKNPEWADDARKGFDYLWAIVQPRFERETPPAPSSSG